MHASNRAARLMAYRLMAVCLLLGLAAASCSSPAAALDPTAQSTPSLPSSPPPNSTPTIDWFPATATPTLLPAPVYSPTPELVTGLGEQLLSDSFTDPESWVTGKTAAGSVAYGQNELTLAVSASKGYLYSLRNDTTLSDYYLEITVTPSLCRGADQFGLLLRASPAPDFYRWVLTCDGQMRLERVKDGTTTPVQAWMARTGPPVVSRLSVWASGREMRFFADGFYQFSASDPVLSSGTVGVFARSTGDNALTVSFSDLSVRVVAAGSSAPAAASPDPSTTPRP
jgi:hypothetical protein